MDDDDDDDDKHDDDGAEVNAFASTMAMVESTAVDQEPRCDDA